jgi:Histidine kinase-, DNA gyrase B-, and HSP90-like ATPase
MIIAEHRSSISAARDNRLRERVAAFEVFGHLSEQKCWAEDRDSLLICSFYGGPIQACFYCLEKCSDSGSGIESANLPRLFESFFTTKSDGMGLGLSVARSIVESHGGRIWADNNTGGGATFHFTLQTTQKVSVN